MDRRLKTLHIFAIVSLILLILTALPLMFAGLYTHPLGDDYHYGVPAFSALKEAGFAAAIKAAAAGTAHQYNIWQGTYSAMFLMHLPPQIFGDLCYKLYPAFVILALTLSVFYILKPLTLTNPEISRDAWIATSSLASVLCLSFVPLMGETFYWFNGSVYYTFFLALTLLMLGGMIRMRRSENPLYLIWLLPLCLIVAGGNYASLLPSLIIIAFMIAASCIAKDRKSAILTSLCMAVLLTGFAISVLAPGNALRQATSYGAGPVKAILKSLLQAGSYLVHWTGLGILIALILLTPVFVYIAKRSSYSFKYPIPVCIVAFGIFASSETPTFYAQNNGGAARVFDICFYMMVGLIFFVYFYFTGWVVKRLSTDKPVPVIKKATAIPAIALVVVFVVSALIRPSFETFQVPNSCKAAKILINGDAKHYDDQYKARRALIDQNPGGDLTFDPYDFSEDIRWFLWLGDLSTDAADNEDFAKFYGLNSVRIR